MQDVIWFLNTYWVYMLAGLLVASKILNKITVHFSEKKGLVKWCLFIIDILDIVKSTPSPKGPKS